MFAGQQDHRYNVGGMNDPLSLGGATSVSSTVGHSSTSQYLPEYLLGDHSSPGTNSPIHSHHRLWSSSLGDSTKHRSHVTVGSPTKFSSNITSNQRNPNTSLSSTETMKLGQPNNINEKHGGPPIQGLFDQNQTASPLSLSTQSPKWQATSTSPSNTSTSLLHGSDYSALHKSLLNKSNINSSMLSPAQLDPFYTQGESLKPDEELDETWVTVFGFPPSAVSYILQEFSLYGSILEHKISGCNNWVHIHYQSKIQAKKALSKNGKIFAGNMMIGVQPCIDKNIMNVSSKENVYTGSPLSFSLPTERSFGQKDETSKSLGIRPLTQAYRVAASDHEVAPFSCTPQKKNSVVTKAMEYVFGW